LLYPTKSNEVVIYIGSYLLASVDNKNNDEIVLFIDIFWSKVSYRGPS
jgi:hypothetical protein